MRQNKWLYRVLLILAAVLLVGAAVYALLDFPKLRMVDMEMQAWELSEDGTVQGSLTLEVKGFFINYRQKNDEFHGDITTPKDYPLRIDSGDNEPYIQQFDFTEKLGAFLAFAFSSGDDGMAFPYLVLDWEQEYLIVAYRDPPKKYLVASVDPAATPQEVLGYFEWVQVLID